MLVHVIKQSGTRFEFDFSEKATDERILSELGMVKAQFGTAKSVKKQDRITGLLVDHPDESSGWAFDYPETVVAVIEVQDGKPVEVRRLKGPAK